MPKIFEHTADQYAKHVVSLDDFRLFSDMENPSFAEETKQTILRFAEEYLNQEYKPILAHSYMRFEKNGNRSIYEGECSERRQMVWYLFLGEYLERKGRFLEKLIDGIWLILDECSWVYPAHTKIRIEYTPKLPLYYKNEVDVVDLFSAETGAMLSFICYLGKDILDAVTPIIRDRILYEVRRRVLLPYLNYSDFWWMGYVRRNINNWCPWITSNVLTACALCEPDMQKRKDITRKCMEVIDHFTLIYHDDGGCDEGPNYWTVAGASYFDCLELLYDITGGYANVFDDPFIRSMGEYIAKVCVNIDENYYINFADAGPRVGIHRNLVTRFGRRTKSAMLENFGLCCPTPNPSMPMKWYLYRSLKNNCEILPPRTEGTYVYPKKAWFGGIEIMVAREAEDTSGLFFAMKGGHNKESHNHNDVGHFVIYENGQPLIIDIGVGTYCADTFNENRYKIFTMRSSYHNLPMFNDVEQRNGFEFRSDDVVYDEEYNRLTLNLKKAYPAESGLCKFIRSGELNDGVVHIIDDVELNKSGKIDFHLMTADEPTITGNNTIRLSTGRTVTFDGRLSATVDKIQLEDPAIIRSWGRDCLYRISLRNENIREGIFKMTIQ
ncbi:MAG: heparinase II/III family protein [Clostridia bacterium]|nr:heparinase II/III family protein [Clostridia bacterium]